MPPKPGAIVIGGALGVPSPPIRAIGLGETVGASLGFAGMTGSFGTAVNGGAGMPSLFGGWSFSFTGAMARDASFGFGGGKTGRLSGLWAGGVGDFGGTSGGESEVPPLCGGVTRTPTFPDFGRSGAAVFLS